MKASCEKANLLYICGGLSTVKGRSRYDAFEAFVVHMEKEFDGM